MTRSDTLKAKPEREAFILRRASWRPVSSAWLDGPAGCRGSIHAPCACTRSSYVRLFNPHYPGQQRVIPQRANRYKRTLTAFETPDDPLFCSQACSVTPVCSVAFLPTTQTVTGHLVTWARVRSMTSCDDAKTLEPDIQRNQ